MVEDRNRDAHTSAAAPGQRPNAHLSTHAGTLHA
jgi:hypothetical protein